MSSILSPQLEDARNCNCSCTGVPVSKVDALAAAHTKAEIQAYIDRTDNSL